MSAIAIVLRYVPFSVSDNNYRLLNSSPGERFEEEIRNHGRRALEVCDGFRSKIETGEFLRMVDNAQPFAVPGCGYKAYDVLNSEIHYARSLRL